MGIRLITEVMDWAPATLTQREHKVLIVLAEDARDGQPGELDSRGYEKRVIWQSLVSEHMLRRARVKRAAMYDVIRALVDQGCLERVVRGGGGHVAKYRIPSLAPILRLGNPDAETEAEAELRPDLAKLRPDSGIAASRKTGPLALMPSGTPQITNGSEVNSSVEGSANGQVKTGGEENEFQQRLRELAAKYRGAP